MVTTEVLVAVSDEEIEELTAKSSEQLRQYVSSKDSLQTLHWNDKLQAKHSVDDFGREIPSSSGETYERLDLDVYWDSLHWLLTGSPDADSVAPHVKLYHYAKKTTHKNLYEITQMENRVTYRFGPLSPHGTRTVTKIFTDKDLAEADVLSNLEDKFDKGYRTAFISDPEERAPKSHSRKRSFHSLGGPSSARKGKKKKDEREEEAEEKGPEETKEDDGDEKKDERKEEARKDERKEEARKEEGKEEEGRGEGEGLQESESEQPREPPPSQASQTSQQQQQQQQQPDHHQQQGQQIPLPEAEETPQATTSTSGLTAGEIVAQHSRAKVEAEERAMERVSTDPKAAYPVSAPETQQARSSATDLVPIPSVQVYEELRKKKRSRAPVEPSDLTPAQLNLELERYGLSLEGGLKKKLARLSLHLMKLFPVEKHPHELGFLAGGGKVLSEHLFKGELRAVSAREAREFSRALEKLGDEALRERFNVDQANQLLFRSVKGFQEGDVEKLLHYAHSLGVFLKGAVKEERGFLVYLK